MKGCLGLFSVMSKKKTHLVLMTKSFVLWIRTIKLESCHGFMLKTYTSQYKVWKSGFAHFILSFLSRKQSSLKHWFWAEENWRCVISVYQPSKSWPSSHKKIAGYFYLTSVIWPGLRQSRRWSDISLFFCHLNTVTIVLMSSVSASDGFIVSLPRLNSLDCSTAGFSLVGWLPLLHLFSLASAC